MFVGNQMVANLRWLIICAILTSVLSVSLNQSIRKPRYTEYHPSTKAPTIEPLITPSTLPNWITVYRASRSNGSTCILLWADGLIEVIFKSRIDDEWYDTYLPDNPTIEANCLYEDTATMKLSWNGYSLLWNFAKTPDGERWYVDKLELTVNKSLNQYYHVASQISGDSFKLVHDQMLFLTPVGMTYTCEESEIKLVPPNLESYPADYWGTLFLRTFQLQPFMYEGSNFGPPFECYAQLGFKDETALIAAGTILAIAALMTVIGYGIFRYFTIKKVQKGVTLVRGQTSRASSACRNMKKVQFL